MANMFKQIERKLVKTADFDTFVRLIVYLVIIFLLLKIFKIL